ncbi:MAG: hypothetical protein LBG91_05090 [Treponema sp.]|jgi:hypothetical protein|nr:hypothetical protein [Treponema sp.]
MKKQVTVILTAILALFVIAGCPVPESRGSVSDVRVFLGGEDKTAGLTIQKGQTVMLKADTGIAPEFVSVAWENESNNVEIVSTGEGVECVIKGKEIGQDNITVRAWRTGEKPVVKTVPVEVQEAEVTGIRIIGDPKIVEGEKRSLAVEVIPVWAQFELVWSASPADYVKLEKIDGIWTIEGLQTGSVTLTGTEGAYSVNIPFTVVTPEPLSDIKIYLNGAPVDNNIDIGVFEEKFLSARITPDNASTFLTWESSSSAVTVDSSGVIKGMTANGTAVITVKAAKGESASVNVKVANPVSGVRIKYDNSDELPVSNIIWLYPDDEVKLKVELMPEDIAGEVEWGGGEGAVELKPDAGNDRLCTIKGVIYDSFDVPPILIRISARNSDNGTKPASTVLQVKILEKEPIWAWDRARDADINQSLKSYGTAPALTSGDYATAHGLPGYSGVSPDANPNNPQPTETFNTEWKIKGRGAMTESMVHTIKRVKVPYTTSGLNLCSVQGAPSSGANSSILVVGSTSNLNTRGVTTARPNGLHVPGIFDFTLYDKPIRISVDFEVISANGRYLAICVNNTDTQFLASPFGNACRLLYRAIVEAKGTKLTAVTYLDAPSFIADKVQGYETLSNALIAIANLSDGCNIYISGIRIEEGE